MRIVLVNPPLKRRYVAMVDEPLHIEYLAAQVAGEHEVILLDSLGLQWTVQETAARLIEQEPDVVGVSMTFTTAYSSARAICSAIKQARPQCTTILGGNTATFMANELALLPEVDLVVRGEADISFPAAIAALQAKASWHSIQGIAFAEEGRVMRPADAPLVPDLDVLPLPARDLLPYGDQYARSVLTARGCAYGCAYCSASAFWCRRYRARSEDSVLPEIVALVEQHGVTHFSFSDDCFTLSPERALGLCSRLIQTFEGLTWNCTGRIETITPELLETMSRAGCRAIFFGVESGSERILHKLRRRYGPEDVERVYRQCILNDIRPYFSFIIGLPFEDRRDLDQTYALIQKLEGVESGVHMQTPFPGTPIAADPEAYGLEILPHTVEDLELNTGCFVNTGFLTAAEIEEAFRNAVGYSMAANRRTRAIHRIRREKQAC